MFCLGDVFRIIKEVGGGGGLWGEVVRGVFVFILKEFWEIIFKGKFKREIL